MTDVSELKCCTDCGTVYVSKYSKDECPNHYCGTQNNEKITSIAN